MASARVEHLLHQITQLSSGEQAELMRGLLRVLQHGSNGGHRSGLSIEAVQQAIQTRQLHSNRPAPFMRTWTRSATTSWRSWQMVVRAPRGIKRGRRATEG